MNYDKLHRKWIENELISELIEEKKLLSTENVELQSLKIERMSHEVAYMLTFCYFVEIVLKVIETDNTPHLDNQNRHVFHIVVKVRCKIAKLKK